MDHDDHPRKAKAWEPNKIKQHLGPFVSAVWLFSWTISFRLDQATFISESTIQSAATYRFLSKKMQLIADMLSFMA